MYIVGLYVYGYTLILHVVFDYWVFLGFGFYEVGKDGGDKHRKMVRERERERQYA